MLASGLAISALTLLLRWRHTWSLSRSVSIIGYRLSTGLVDHLEGSSLAYMVGIN